jgi:hypothetical protein
MVIINLDTSNDLQTINTSQFHLLCSNQRVSLRSAQYAPIANNFRSIRLQYSSTLSTAPDFAACLTHSSDILLEIGPQAYSFSNEVQNVTGNFSVSMFCTHAFLVCNRHSNFGSPPDPSVSDSCPCLPRSNFSSIADFVTCRRRCDFRSTLLGRQSCLAACFTRLAGCL